jgi:pimeloyl-ACP methyl ester carboxylesterase
MIESVVLVPGAWHRAASWDRVIPQLRRQGLEVSALTLPGLSEDAGRGAPPGLQDHIDAVAQAVRSATGQVLLVGHSYAGMPVTGAASPLRHKVGRIVYLDAAVPRAGQSFASHIPGIDATAVARREQAFRSLADEHGWLPVPAFATLGIEQAADQAWLGPRLAPHPLRTWLEPLPAASDTRAIAKTYILATRPPTGVMGYPLHGEAARQGGEWTYREIQAGHELMVLAADETAALLVEAASA